MRKAFVFLAIAMLLTSCKQLSDIFTIGSEISETEMIEKLSAIELPEAYTAIKLEMENTTESLTIIMDTTAHYFFWHGSKSNFWGSSDYYYYDYIKDDIYYRVRDKQRSDGVNVDGRHTQEYAQFTDTPLERWQQYYLYPMNSIYPNDLLGFINDFSDILIGMIANQADASSSIFRYDETTESLSIVLQQDENITVSYLVTGNHVVSQQSVQYGSTERVTFIYDGFELEYPDLSTYTENADLA